MRAGARVACLTRIVSIVLLACGKDPAPDALDVTVAADTAGVPDGREVVADLIADGGVDALPEVGGLPCQEDRDCLLPCAEGRCELNRCAYGGPQPGASGCVAGESPLCVLAGTPSRERACFFCNPSDDVAGYTAYALREGFETGAGRLLIDKLTPSSASWTISSARAASGARSLYFGDPATLRYDVGQRAAARAVTPPLILPEPALPLRLTCQLFADTEQTPTFDRLRVLVLPPDASDEPAVVWTSDAIGGTTHGEFLPLDIDLGLTPNGARVAFEADSVDEMINDFEGFYLDDVSLGSGCCDGAHGCDDGNPCTSDACQDGECTFTVSASCCLADADCADGDACTADRCARLSGQAGGACVSTPRQECCTVARDCDDLDPCTEDACLVDASGAGSCSNAPLCCERDADCEDGDACTLGECLAGQCRYRSSCCHSDVDCDDALACTTDRCVGGTCSYELTYAAGCCLPDVLTERFDAGQPAGWVFSPPTNNIGWRVQAEADAPSGTSVLYYGHPTLSFYESGGRNTGTATSRAMHLPDAVELSLSLQILIDLEANPQRDLFTIEAVLADTSIVLIDKAELVPGVWQEVSVDLSWAAARTIQLRFVFDTVDGAQNTTRGILIDDVRLLSSCLPRRCGVDAECTSRASCISGACEDGVCRYGGGC